jgi:hypothetical protein
MEVRVIPVTDEYRENYERVFGRGGHVERPNVEDYSHYVKDELGVSPLRICFGESDG